MTITFFTTHMKMGGAQQAMLTLAEGFVDRGYDVDLVLVNAEGEFLQRVPDAVNVVDLKADRVLTAVGPLRAYLAKTEPDVLISTITVTNLVACWARLAARADTRVVLRESVVFSRHTASYSPLKRRLMPWLVRYTYRSADTIIGVTHETRHDIANVTGLPADELYTIYNDLDVEAILERAAEPTGHPWFDDSEQDEPIILGAGRLSEQKDFQTLIYAFARLAEPARLVIIGEGGERETLEQLVADYGLEDRVSLPGYQDNPYAYMAKADVFVLSSAWEGTANVLLEAMACGTPVVSTDCGTAELLGDGERGPIVPIGDSDALAGSIEELLHEPTNGEVLQEWVRENCSSMVDEYEHVVRMLLK